MLPDNFLKRIYCQKYIDGDSLIKALQEPSPVSIRINSSKWNKKPLNSDPVPWCETGFYLEKRPSYTLDPLFHSGCYYPQEASGMFIEQAFRQVADKGRYIRVLDLCGAPGGKSTHLSSLIGPNGLFIANEVIKTRAAVLAGNIINWGNANTLVTRNDPSAFSGLQSFFDVILVDAPCSGEGMFRDSVAIDEWSEQNTIHCTERQKRILSDVWPSLKENGVLIYSTCTFNPGENEENIRWMVDKKMAETVELKISDFIGITEIDYQGVKGYGFYPGRIRGEGLFISVIRKTGNSAEIKSRINKKHASELKRTDIEIVKEWTNFQVENIIRTGDEIYCVPGKVEDYRILESKLKIILPGTRICKVKNNGYIPSHELALSVNFKRNAFPEARLDYGRALAYLRRDNLSIGSLPKGWITAIYSDVSLGFCNNLGNRINNYFPVDQRIRMDIPENAVSNIITWTNQ